MQKRTHPVREYLRALTWDRKSRLETWLINNTGAEDTELTRKGSKIMLLQAVARVVNPGCQCDVVFTLEGEQGIGKSSLVRILGGEYYADVPVQPDNKDTVLAMQGKWFLEMSEMVVQKKAGADAIKSFLTKPYDRLRAPYASKPEDIKRQSVFIGTINLDATKEYLNDPTGNRRFWPIDLKDREIDRQGLQKIRDQLFAEAYHRIVEKGELWHLTDKSMVKKLNTEQKARQMSDGWIPAIQEWIENQYFVTGIEAYEGALNGNRSTYKRLESTRMAQCLRELGYDADSQRVSGKLTRGYSNKNNKAFKEKGLFG